MSQEREPKTGIQKDVFAVGEDFRQSLDFNQPVVTVKSQIPALFQRIRDLPLEVIEFSLGTKFGRSLKGFVSAVDLTHPDVQTLFEGCLGDESDFALDLRELLYLGEYAHSKGLVRVLPIFGKKIVTQERDRRQCLRAIGDPKDNRVHVRLLKSESLREKVRQKKHPQKIELGVITKKGDELWEALHSSFRVFVRGMPVYREEIELAEKKAHRFKTLGCSGLADEIEKSIDTFKVQVSECYHGFNRITLTVAAVVLAKAHGYTVSTVQSHWESGDRKSCIKVPKTRFYDLNHEAEPSYIGMTQPLRMDRSDYYFYQPRAYPAHWFDNLASKETKDLIACLDHFPETGGKPIFDHFIVIVPGVQYPTSGHDDYWKFRLPNGQIETFATADLAAEALDMVLIEEGYIQPVLLGERDGKCYFIDYWRGHGQGKTERETVLEGVGQVS